MAIFFEWNCWDRTLICFCLPVLRSVVANSVCIGFFWRDYNGVVGNRRSAIAAIKRDGREIQQINRVVKLVQNPLHRSWPPQHNSESHNTTTIHRSPFGSGLLHFNITCTRLLCTVQSFTAASTSYIIIIRAVELGLANPPPPPVLSVCCALNDCTLSRDSWLQIAHADSQRRERRRGRRWCFILLHTTTGLDTRVEE